MKKKEFITYSELVAILQNDSTDNNFKAAADNLLEAFTDWPTQNIEEPIDMLLELKFQINDKLTFENLSKFSKTLKPDKDAWKMESLASLLELFDFERDNNVDKEIELEGII